MTALIIGLLIGFVIGYAVGFRRGQKDERMALILMSLRSKGEWKP